MSDWSQWFAGILTTLDLLGNRTWNYSGQCYLAMKIKVWLMTNKTNKQVVWILWRKYNINVLANTPPHVVLDVLQISTVAQAIYFHLVKITSVSLSCSPFSWTILAFLSPYFPSFSSFFLSHGVPSLFLSISPASKSLRPSIMTMDLNFAKHLPSLSYFAFLF